MGWKFHYHLMKFQHRLNEFREPQARREEYCRLVSEYIVPCSWNTQRRKRWKTKALLKIMRCQDLFPSDEDKLYFLQFGLREYRWEVIEELGKSPGFDIDEFKFEDGRSIMHYLADAYGSREFYDRKWKTANLVKHLLARADPTTNHSDERGYSYMHAACMMDNIGLVDELLENGVDVNLDTYTCSPLHIAAWYRRANVLKSLLGSGADPNQLDHEGSTALHALAWTCFCECVSAYNFCDTKRPVEELVQELVRYGADLEVRNDRGDTALQLAVSRFDAPLVRALLARGADLSSLSEERMFASDFTSLELKCNALTLDVIEVMRLLKEAGYKMDSFAKMRMIKFWLRVRGNDVEHLVGDDTGDPIKDERIFTQIVDRLYMIDKFGWFIKPESVYYLQERCRQLLSRMPTNRNDYYPDLGWVEDWNDEINEMRRMSVTEHVDLFDLCQMDYELAYDSIKTTLTNYWPAPVTKECGYFGIMAKRHVANVLIRTSFDMCLLATDLFMTESCILHLPKIVCLQIAEYLNHEDYLFLFEHVNVDELMEECECNVCRSNIRYIWDGSRGVDAAK